MGDQNLKTDVKELTVHGLAIVVLIICQIIFAAVPYPGVHPIIRFMVSAVLSFLAFQGFKNERNHWLLVICNTALIYTATLGIQHSPKEIGQTVAMLSNSFSGDAATVADVPTHAEAAYTREIINIREIANNPEELERMKTAIELIKKNPKLLDVHPASFEKSEAVQQEKE